MSEALDLLNSLTEDQIAAYTATPKTEPHIVINTDRYIIVPEELKRIAVQYDRDIETVIFDCPRYWDEHDLSKMKVYVNYKRSDGYEDAYVPKNVQVSAADDSIMNFEWVISDTVTETAGKLTVSVSIEKTDEDGHEEKVWNSEQCEDMYVSKGMKPAAKTVQSKPDILTHVLSLYDAIEAMYDDISAAHALVPEVRDIYETFMEEAETNYEKFEEINVDIDSKYEEVVNLGDQLQASYDKSIAAVNSRIDRNDKRLTNVETALFKEPFVIDSSIAYTKDVPENAPPYAEVTKIGGMTRKCTNLLPFPYASTNKTDNGITWTVNADGTVTANGTATANSTHHLHTNLMLPSGNYVLSTTGEGGKTSAVLYYKDENGQTVYITAYSEKSFSLTEQKEIGLYLQVFSGYTVSNFVFEPMLNPGDTALPYEPYFEGLRSAPVTEVESVGVNLFDIDTFANENGLVAQSDGSYKGSNMVRTLWRNTNKKAGKIFFSYEGKIESSTGSPLTFQFFYTDGTNQYGTTLQNATDFKRLEFESNADKTVEHITWMYSVSGSYYVKNMMLSFVDTEYKPYVRSTLPIPEAVQNIDGYGWGVKLKPNYIDYVSGKFFQYVKRKVFNGTENWVAYRQNEWTDGYCKFQVGIGSTYSTDNIVANYLEAMMGLTSDGTYLPNTCMIHSNGNLYVAIEKNGVTSVETWKTYLAENPLEVYYPLAEPVITDISDLLPDDNYIGVESGGTVTMVNEYGYDVPSEVTYQLDTEESEVVTE